MIIAKIHNPPNFVKIVASLVIAITTFCLSFQSHAKGYGRHLPHNQGMYFPAPCESFEDSSLVFYEDFSGTDPLLAFLVENPPGSGQSARAISVVSERLSSAYAGGFGVAKVSTLDSFPFRCHSVEGVVNFTTASSVRSAAGVHWQDQVATNYRAIQLFLQDDENRVYLEVDGRGPSLTGPYTLTPISFNVDPNTDYRLRIEIIPDGLTNHRILGYVDDVLKFDVSHNISSFPVSLRPGFSGNSKSAVDLKYDNLTVRSLNPCDGIVVSRFLTPMGGRHAIGRTLPIRFKMCFDGMQVTSQDQLDLILDDPCSTVDCPTLKIFEVVGNTATEIYPLPPNRLDGDCFKYRNGAWTYLLKLDRNVFKYNKHYMVELLIGDCVFDEQQNYLFSTRKRWGSRFFRH